MKVLHLAENVLSFKDLKVGDRFIYRNEEHIKVYYIRNSIGDTFEAVGLETGMHVKVDGDASVTLAGESAVPTVSFRAVPIGHIFLHDGSSYIKTTMSSGGGVNAIKIGTEKKVNVAANTQVYLAKSVTMGYA